MRLLNFLLKIKEEGEVGSGATTTNNVAQYAPKLTMARRQTRRKTKTVRKSKLLG